jgi:adenylate cyclase
MGRDEAGTLVHLREHRKKRLEPALARYGGRLVKLMGDGALVEFASAVDALSAAIEFQQAVADTNQARRETECILFRIGLHIGDLIVDGDDLYGDGVNVAARLQAEAQPGGIIISRAVREAVEGRTKAKLYALGELALKNIERPIRAFRVEWEAVDWPSSTDVPGQQAEPAMPSTPPLPLPDKPSIAVLPFQNMSGDPEQEYFADGMVEEIITALSRNRWLFVIARNSTFTYKGHAVDVKQVGRALGVRYVLEGSVRKAGSQVRITGQLIESETGAHLWAERFDGSLEDIFKLQDRVANSVAGVIEPTLQAAEIRRTAQWPTNDLTAYDLYLRGLALCFSWERTATVRALELCASRIEQPASLGVVAKKQGAEVRTAAARFRPADDNELLAVQALGLEPQAAIARNVGLVDPLRHHALYAQLAGLLAEARTVTHDVIGEAQTTDLALEQGPQPFLALDQGQPGGVLAVQEQQVEGHQHQRIGAPLVHGGLEAAECRHAIGTESAQLAIEVGRLHGQ